MFLVFFSFSEVHQDFIWLLFHTCKNLFFFLTNFVFHSFLETRTLRLLFFNVFYVTNISNETFQLWSVNYHFEPNYNLKKARIKKGTLNSALLRRKKKEQIKGLNLPRHHIIFLWKKMKTLLRIKPNQL